MELISNLVTRLRYWLPAGSPTMDCLVDTRSGLLADDVFVFEGLSTALLTALRRHAATQDHDGDQPPLWLVKYEVAKTIQDCLEAHREGMTMQIYQASTVADLGGLLPSVWSCIVQTHGEQTARRRLSALSPFFPAQQFNPAMQPATAVQMA